MPGPLPPRPPRPRTAEEVFAWLDARLEPVMKELYREEKEAGADARLLSGAVSGFLIKTAVGLALSNRCPREALVGAIQEEFKRFPGSL